MLYPVALCSAGFPTAMRFFFLLLRSRLQVSILSAAAIECFTGHIRLVSLLVFVVVVVKIYIYIYSAGWYTYPTWTPAHENQSVQ